MRIKKEIPRMEKSLLFAARMAFKSPCWRVLYTWYICLGRGLLGEKGALKKIFIKNKQTKTSSYHHPTWTLDEYNLKTEALIKIIVLAKQVDSSQWIWFCDARLWQKKNKRTVSDWAAPSSNSRLGGIPAFQNRSFLLDRMCWRPTVDLVYQPLCNELAIWDYIPGDISNDDFVEWEPAV